MATVANPLDYSRQLFENAKQAFLDDLKKSSHSYRANLHREILTTATNIDQVYLAVEKLQADQAKHGHMRNLGRIGPYLQVLEKYASSVEVFVSIKPDVMALIWGPIKLLLLWTTNIKNGFDALMDTLARIGQLLPQFDRIREVIRDDERIKSLLGLFYRDLLDFYSVSIKFFGQNKWQLFFTSLWPKCLDQIKVIEGNIEKHAQLLREEVTLDHIRLEHQARIDTLAAFKKTEDIQSRQRFLTLQTAINPHLYDDRLNWLRGRACKTTSRWLAREPEFIQWMDTSTRSNKILWLHGIPGAGKTFLAGWVVHKAIEDHHRTLYAFASHTYADTTAVTVLHSLLFQLASDDPNLQTVLSEAKERDLKSNTEFVKSTLKTALQSTSGFTFLLVDGLDEVDSFERKRILFFLLEVLKECPTVRVCVSSRMDDDIDKIISKDAMAVRVDHKNRSSIKSYVDMRTESWMLDSGFDEATKLELQGPIAAVVTFAKGMFLYARVVLDNVQLLTDMDEIRQELRALPRDLDAAYDRVFAKLNSLPPVQSEKGRKILGWIGCSPIPMTIREMEQALLVRHGMQDLPLVRAPAQIVALCGPIVEMVDGTVQFVHFTVKEYVFNHQVKGSLSLNGSTADLLQTCLIYLCCPALNYSIIRKQIKEERDKTENEASRRKQALRDPIIQGKFRFLHFATSAWLPLVSKYLLLVRDGAEPGALGPLLDDFAKERVNKKFKEPNEVDTKPNIMLSSLLDDWPEASQLFSRAVRFRNHRDRDDWTIHNPQTWAAHDPLTVSRSYAEIGNMFERIPCPAGGHSQPSCDCDALKRHYGDNMYKCIFLSCPYRRLGFSSVTECADHIKHHNRPYKCRVPTCDFSQLGFLTRVDEHNHWEKYHYIPPPESSSTQSIPNDTNELRLLLFDLISTQQVTAVQALSPTAFLHLLVATDNYWKAQGCIFEMTYLAASVGSMPITRLLINFTTDEPDFRPDIYQWDKFPRLLSSALKGRNPDIIRYILAEVLTRSTDSNLRESYHDGVPVLYRVVATILKSPLLEAGAILRDLFIEMVCPRLHDYRRVVSSELLNTGRTNLLRAAAQNPMQEVHLLEIWTALFDVSSSSSPHEQPPISPETINNALIRVASEGGSAEQARVLIDVGGARVNSRRVEEGPDNEEEDDRRYKVKGRGMTALHWAARRTDEDGAKMVRLLLRRGADEKMGWAGKKPGEEKGTREIKRWLGVTWEELVESVRGVEKVRMEGENDDEGEGDEAGEGSELRDSSELDDTDME